MALNETPNRLEAVFVQRDPTNAYYEQINVSGSNLIVYLSSSGELQADKIAVWAAKYGIGSGGGGGSTVKVTALDTTANYLASKLAAGSGITLTVLNPGANETLQITSTGGGVSPTIGTESASFNPLAVSTGSIVFWMHSVSSSFHDLYGGISASYAGQIVRRVRDLSGNNNHCYYRVQDSPKAAIAYGGAPNGTHKFVYFGYTSGIKLISDAVTFIKPYWLFVAGRGAASSSVQSAVFDGLGASNRMLCTIGPVCQLYAGASLTAPNTASHALSWGVYTFKSNGASSFIRRNGVQIVAGNAGTQTVLGLTIAGDYNGNGGDSSVLEMIIGYCLADEDATNIENYLMNRYGITP